MITARARALSARCQLPLSSPPLTMICVGTAKTLDGVQTWYRSNPQSTKPHACVLFADCAFLESHEHTFQPRSGVKLFKLVPSTGTKEKLDAKEVVEWRNDINYKPKNAPPPGGSDAQCSSASSSSDFALFITLVHYGGDEAGTKHALFGHKENENELSRKFTSFHIFAQDAEQQEHVYEKLSKVNKWHNVFTDDFLPCGLPKEGPRPMIRSFATRQARGGVARPMDPDFHKRREEFNLQRAQEFQLGQRADDLFMVNNMALTRRCIGQQVWEQYRRWYGDPKAMATTFHHADTFESFRSECKASPLLSSSGENPYGDRSEPPLTVEGAVSEMRKAKTVDHWLAHMYRLEVDFLTEKTGRVVVNHRGVCDAVLQRVAGEGGAAETSHALFSLAIGTRIPLTAELVANACSDIHLFRKVHYEIEASAETKGKLKSPHSEAHDATPMEVDGGAGRADLQLEPCAAANQAAWDRSKRARVSEDQAAHLASSAGAPGQQDDS